jgi:hypothetical protein
MRDELDHSALVAFRVLKSHMAKIRSQGDELMFFSLEMRMERRLMRWRTSPFSKLLSFAYDAVSIYGLSPGRALTALFLWNIGAFVLFATLGLVYEWSIHSSFPYWLGIPSSEIAIVESSLGGSGGLIENAPVVGLVIQNALNPLALISPKSLVLTKSWWIFGISVVQSAGVVAIATLFVLAIRSRFQKGSGGGDR